MLARFVNWSVVFVEAIFQSSFTFSCMLLISAFALNHVNRVFRVTCNVVSNRSCFACRVECVRNKLLEYVGARTTMTRANINPAPN